METAVLSESVTATREKFGSPASFLSTGSEQVVWATRPIRERIQVLRIARYELASQSASFAEAISSDLSRTPADTRAAEILPLLAACRFLEDHLHAILAVRRLGKRGLPFWLAGVDSEVHRVPLGRVLVIAPSNYPLFLPGVQVLQALAAGNSVTWKPGRGGSAVAKLFAESMSRAGLPAGLLHIAEDTVAATYQALEHLPDKVFFTGSADVGRILMRKLAETLTPSVMELSGCDAVVILPSADLSRVIQALAFGMRLNGSATCMAPRRVLLVDASTDRKAEFITQLRCALARINATKISDGVLQQLQKLLQNAKREGACVFGDATTANLTPMLVTGVRPEMHLAQADVFAPVLSVIDVTSEAGIYMAQQACPLALTVSIFGGDEKQARRIAEKLVVGSVVINDIIVPTADPRLPFGGRRGSGFGVTRGVEGLLEMTAVKTVAVRKGKSKRHYEVTTTAHEAMFDGLIAASHSKTWAERWRGIKRVAAAGKLLSRDNRIEDQHGK